MITGSTPLSHTYRITLYLNSPRIDIENHVSQGFNSPYFYNFGFNISAPLTNHEEVGAVLTAKLSNQVSSL